MSTVGSGKPTKPGFLLLRRYGFEMAIPISVIPYRSSNQCPLISYHFSITDTGKAAEPETINLFLRRFPFISPARRSESPSIYVINL